MSTSGLFWLKMGNLEEFILTPVLIIASREVNVRWADFLRSLSCFLNTTVSAAIEPLSGDCYLRCFCRSQRDIPRLYL